MSRPAITLVLLPGMDGTGELFAAFVDALGDAATPLVVAYPPDEPLDYEGVTSFAHARLPRDRPFVLLGESFSGPVAIALAATRPPGLVGLVLCCSFARNPTPAFSMFRHVLGALPISASFISLIAPFLLGSNSSLPLRKDLRAAVAQIPAAVMRVRLRAVLEIDYSAKMREIEVPMLYLQAAQDRVVPRGAASHLVALAPHMKCCRLRGPHLLLQTNPGGGALAVSDFIRSLQP